MPKILPGETDLYALTDSRLSRGRSLEFVARELLKSGIKILQYREKHAPVRQKYQECLLLRKLTQEYEACFIVNDHLDLALIAHADGLHVGQDDLPLKAIRKAAPHLLIGISTHSPDQAQVALRDGADYIGVGPIYPTSTKEDVVAPVGTNYLDWVVHNISLPFVAIGGIKTSHIPQIWAHGARCCAMVSELVGADNIGKKVEEARACISAFQNDRAGA